MTMPGRAITLYCDLIARAAIDGISRAQGDAGVDIGAQEEVHEPVILESAPPIAEEGAAATMADAEAVEPQAASRRPPGRAGSAAPQAVFAAPEGEPDDLEAHHRRRSGARAEAARSRRHPIDQIANFNDEDVEKIDRALNIKGRVAKDDWVGQARHSSAGA